MLHTTSNVKTHVELGIFIEYDPPEIAKRLFSILMRNEG